MSALLQAALGYARRDWPVFPVNGKRPLTAHGLLDASTDAETIAAWWKRWPDADVALRTGDGVLVLDVDDGDALHELEVEHGELPHTVRAVTGGGGEHLFFTIGEPVRSSAGRPAAGLDVRADGGYVVLPPSVHETGRTYEWDEPPAETPLAPAPAWLLERLTTHRRNGAPPVGEEIPEGKRNDTLVSLAGSMRRRGMGEAEIQAALKVTNGERCQPPLDDGEVGSIAASVARYEPAPMSSREDMPVEVEEPAEGASAVTAASVLAERVEWLSEGRIPRGAVTLLIGDPGLGKSLATCRQAARTSRRGGTVLMATAEDALAAVVRPRLEAAGADLERVRFVQMRHDGIESGIELPDDIAELERLVREHEVDLVVIDPLMAHLPETVNSWRDQSVRRALAPLHRLAEATGSAVVVVAHMNKGGSSDPLMRTGGSIGIPAAARSALLLARDPDDPEGDRGSRRVLAHFKCNLAPLAPSLQLEVEPVTVAGGIETARLELIGESGHSGRDLLDAPVGDERSALDEAREFLEGELAGAERDVREVQTAARAAGVTDRTLRRARKELGVESGRVGGVADQGFWTWRLPKAANAKAANPISGLGPLRQNPHSNAENGSAEALRGPSQIDGPLSGQRSVHFSSETPEWSTPRDLFDELDREFDFELDVCATPENAKCERHFTPEDDGLRQTWVGTCWMNPPYGREIGRWIEKAWGAARSGATVVCLVPARTDTRWWHDYCQHGEVRLLRGRLRFGDAKAGAPFPSAVVIFRPPETAWDQSAAEEFIERAKEIFPGSMELPLDEEAGP